LAAQVSPTVLFASEDPTLLEEFIRFTEGIPQWRMLPPASSKGELLASLDSGTADVVVITDGIMRELESHESAMISSRRTLVVARTEEVGTLRQALKLGAAGFLLWPKERQELRRLVEESFQADKPSLGVAGQLTAVWSPKGGSGSTVIAAHLAGASSQLKDTVLVDLDLDHGDQSVLFPATEDVKTTIDLLRVATEITPSVIDQIAYRHGSGVRVIFSPASPGESDIVKTSDLSAALQLVRASVAHLIVDLPTGIHDLAITVAEEADAIVLVVTCDMLSLKRGRDAMRLIRSSGLDASKVSVLVNAQSSGSDITLKDVEAVIGRPVAISVRGDSGLAAAPDRGELAQSGLRLLEPLARKLLGIPGKTTRGSRKVFSSR